MAVYLGATELSTGGGGGGGAFTNMARYSTLKSTGEFENKVFQFVNCQSPGFSPAGSSTITLANFTSGWTMIGSLADIITGQTITTGGNTYTLGTNTAGPTQKINSAGGSLTYNITPNLAVDVQGGQQVSVNASGTTVNPASDLGLANGAKLFYFMVGGGDSGYDGWAGWGGRIIQGITTIANASTNLTLFIGEGANLNGGYYGTDTTISGGLTKTTLDGQQATGTGSTAAQSAYVSTASAPGSGIAGFGCGGAAYKGGYGPINPASGNSFTQYGIFHGYGSGGAGRSGTEWVGSDGSITFFY